MMWQRWEPRRLCLATVVTLLSGSLGVLAPTEPRCIPVPVECAGSPCGDSSCPEGMTYVPEGSFPMGSPDGEADPPWGTHSGERPQHTVHVPAFCIDRHEVTAGEYVAFLVESGSSRCGDWRCVEGLDDPDTGDFYWHPQLGWDDQWAVQNACQLEPGGMLHGSCADHAVNYVMWTGADEYCRWRGYRLPTEAEWERAAKGDSHRVYVWGDEPPWPGVANCNESLCADGYESTAPVGSFASDVSPFGCMDMTGNVLEWVEDDYHRGYEGAPTDGSAWIDSPRSNERSFRGASWSWIGDHASDLRTSLRGYGSVSYTTEINGFRCAATILGQGR